MGAGGAGRAAGLRAISEAIVAHKQSPVTARPLLLGVEGADDNNWAALTELEPESEHQSEPEPEPSTKVRAGAGA